MKERWKKVPGYDGYEVSDRGRVRSYWARGAAKQKFNVTPVLLKPYKMRWRNRRGYYWRVSLWIGRGYKKFFIHQLVLLAFTGKIPIHCRHFDNDVDNNSLRNLRHGDAKSNAADRKRHGTLLCGSRHYWSRLTERNVGSILRKADRGLSSREIASHYDVTQQAIANILAGRTWGWFTKRKRGVG